MNKLKLLNSEIHLNEQDLKILNILDKNLKKEEKSTSKKKTAIKELEHISKQAHRYIKKAKKMSENIKKKQKVDLPLVQEVYNEIRNMDRILTELRENYMLAAYKVKMGDDQIYQELSKLHNDLVLNAREIYELLAEERTSHYIQ